jgi:hypothetical protein
MAWYLITYRIRLHGVVFSEAQGQLYLTSFSRQIHIPFSYVPKNFTTRWKDGLKSQIFSMRRLLNSKSRSDVQSGVTCLTN